MVTITYYYRNIPKSKIHETIIDALTNALASMIELPPSLEVCIYDLPNSVYGGMDKYISNRIGINSKLSIDDIPKILVHELIHVHQRYTKLLEIKNGGMYYWRGIPYEDVMPENMDYQDYKNCPWEIDVEMKIDKLLTDCILLAKEKYLPKFDNKST